MPRLNVARKLIERHLVAGRAVPGEEIALRIDQTLTQDATGTAVMLELEAIGVARVRTELSVQYVDHNLIAADHRNPDDHEFLRTSAAKYGIWFSPPGNGVSHPLHQQHFGIPGKTLLGSDSHTPAAGALGMLAIGGGGIEVAMAMTGEPLRIRMPEVWGIELTGSLPPWVSAKDVVLEMLRRHGVEGAKGRILEYFGPGLASLRAMDRHVIANMGTEMGALSTVFPSDSEVARFLDAEGRGADWVGLEADEGADYERRETLDLGRVEPAIAMPSSPGAVCKVRDVVDMPIHQAYVGSSANPGYRDFAVVAEIVAGRRVHPGVSLDINPTSRKTLAELARSGHLERLVEAGARLHQAGCNGCIGMGQAPATDRISLRTVPRNFPGRSGTVEDKVCLVSPETAAASALTGRITDPRELGDELRYPDIEPPARRAPTLTHFVRPPSRAQARRIEIVRGPNIAPLPRFDGLPQALELQVLLSLDDDVSTDEIMPAGAKVLPLRSNIPKISAFAFRDVAHDYADRAQRVRDRGGHAIVAGRNYGQGSSREHAALAPRYLGLRCVLALGFAALHHRNLVHYGVVPLRIDEEDRARLRCGDTIVIGDVAAQLARGQEVDVHVRGAGWSFVGRHDLVARQIEIIRSGGLIACAAEREVG